MLKIEITTWR